MYKYKSFDSSTSSLGINSIYEIGKLNATMEFR